MNEEQAILQDQHEEQIKSLMDASLKELLAKDARIAELESQSQYNKEWVDVAAEKIKALETRIEKLRKALWRYGGSATWDGEKNSSIASQALANDDQLSAQDAR